jgi:hypothetical protein
MEIDQSSLGAHIGEQMQAIEEDPDVPEGAEIGAIVTLVEVLGPEQPDGTRFRNFRVRSNIPPHPTIGALEEAKLGQLAMVQQGS